MLSSVRVVWLTLSLVVLVSEVSSQCDPNPCGINADCSVRGRAVCKCRPNYEGDPFVRCYVLPEWFEK